MICPFFVLWSDRLSPCSLSGFRTHSDTRSHTAAENAPSPRGGSSTSGRSPAQIERKDREQEEEQEQEQVSPATLSPVNEGDEGAEDTGENNEQEQELELELGRKLFPANEG